ncbi:MAG: carbohydrate kinase family protein [Steroidobacteraceae bacterium]
MTRSAAKKSVLICGSAAYDSILLFQDRFKAHILPEKIHLLNVSFLVPEMRREFGGCATNIAYNLKLLGEHAYPMATVGHDFGPYRESLQRKGVPLDHLRVIDSAFTAQAFITTDLDDNQITAFHPGAMQEAHLNRVADASGIGLGVVAPDGRQAMIEHATQFASAGIPFLFDPGQGLPMFEGAELRHFIEQATWVAVNDYEWQVLQQKTGWTVREITARVKALIITRGAQGSLIHTPTEAIDIPCATPAAVVDPTGCGDAYRAGLIHGILRGEDWATAGRLASLMGAIKVESRGPQNHRFTREQFDQRFRDSF